MKTIVATYMGHEKLIVYKYVCIYYILYFKQQFGDCFEFFLVGSSTELLIETVKVVRKSFGVITLLR